MGVQTGTKAIYGVNKMAMENKYESYRADQFLEDAFFIEWIKYQTPAADRFWRSYISQQPSNLKALQEAETELRALLAVRRITAEATDAAEVWDRVQQSIQGTADNMPGGTVLVRPGSFYRRWWAAAAAVLFLVFGLWFYSRETSDVRRETAVGPKVQDIVPGGDKAVLTLADGRKVILDSAENGALTKQGNVTVIKLDGGRLAYQPSSSPSASALTYNTITTPRGGQYQLVLADGTQVWLNAASSLRFPTAFAGKERRVELTGEGYFEVAHDAATPFHVQVNDMEVQVLGTHFNINSYSDEPFVKTTLLEGSVRVRSGTQEAVLKPGQQAQLQTTSHKLQTTNNVDVEQVMAWKNGLFVFNRADIETILRQAARWYDVDVEYRGKINETFSGGLPRSENISQLLKIFEATGKVNFIINGKKIMVQPK